MKKKLISDHGLFSPYYVRLSDDTGAQCGGTSWFVLFISRNNLRQDNMLH